MPDTQPERQNLRQLISPAQKKSTARPSSRRRPNSWSNASRNTPASSRPGASPSSGQRQGARSLPAIHWLWALQKEVYLPVLHPFTPGHLLFLRYTATTP
jgi:5-formyltetrahydrofolate cyclo-ligase